MGVNNKVNISLKEQAKLIDRGVLKQILSRGNDQKGEFTAETSKLQLMRLSLDPGLPVV